MLPLLVHKPNACFQDVQRCMSFSQLKLNPDRTVIIISVRRLNIQTMFSHITVIIVRHFLYLDTIGNLCV